MGLSDRREEGDVFVPPDPSAQYLEKLSNLIEEEEVSRQRRRDHFFSQNFAMDNVGPLFPATWTSPLGIGNLPLPQKHHELHTRPGYCTNTRMQHVLRSSIPVFEKSTEDGTKFCIYQVGSLQVRTTQEHDGQEIIGVVFSSHASVQRSGPHGNQSAGEVDKIVKVTQYVEATNDASLHRFYVTFETESGNFLVAEQFSHAKLALAENPTDLEARNSMAKVICSVDCQEAGICVKDAKDDASKVLMQVLC